MCAEPENVGLKLMEAAAESAGRESINKISYALGARFPFWGMKKRAAEAYVKSIENGNYSADEKYILIAGAKKHCRELENQMAIAEIAQQAAADGTDFSMNSKVSDEFVSRFMDAGKHVSDEETQLLWGSVLAGEFETPGSTPWSVIRILSELTKEYAEIFSRLCSLQFDLLIDTKGKISRDKSCLMIGTRGNERYLSELGLSFVAFQELNRLGLINTDFTSGFSFSIQNGSYQHLHLVSEREVITITQLRNDELPVGYVILTEPGRCISRFSKRNPNSIHIKETKKFLSQKGVMLANNPTIEITRIPEEETDRGYSYRRIPQEQQQTPKPK